MREISGFAITKKNLEQTCVIFKVATLWGEKNIPESILKKPRAPILFI